MIALVVIIRRNSPRDARDHFAGPGNKTPSGAPSSGQCVVDRVWVCFTRFAVACFIRFIVAAVNLHFDPDRGRAGWRWDLLQGGDCQH